MAGQILIDIKLPMILIGDGELIKYRTIEDAEKDLEAYDIDNYVIYDKKCRKIILYKKDKYYRVGFKIINKESKCDELQQTIKRYLEENKIGGYESNNLDDWIQEIPFYRINE